MIPSPPDRSLAAAAAAVRGALLDPHAAGLTFTSASIDSRTLQAGQLFFAIRGPRFDGHAFLEDAAERGAIAAVVAETPEQRPRNLPLVRVDDTTEALPISRSREASWGGPLVAITGSTGKTTTKEMTARILETQGSGALDGRESQQPVRPPVDASAPRGPVTTSPWSSSGCRRRGAAPPVEDGCARRRRHHERRLGPPRLLRVRRRHCRRPRRKSSMACGPAACRSQPRRPSPRARGRGERVVPSSGSVSVVTRTCRPHPSLLSGGKRSASCSRRAEGPFPSPSRWSGPHFVSDFLAAAAAARCLGVAVEDVVEPRPLSLPLTAEVSCGSSEEVFVCSTTATTRARRPSRRPFDVST